MTGAWRTLSVALVANTGGFIGPMGKASLAAKGFGIAVAAGLAASIGEAIKFESAMAGVAKTIDATAAEMAVLEQGIVDMSMRLPASREEIAGVAEAAGQLGISKGALLEFTEVAVMLGTTTNMAADDAATGLAKIATVMGVAEGDFDRMGSTLVELGNNGASTEADITAMTQRLSGIGVIIGASAAEMMGMANAMSSVGIEAELGGGAMQRVLQGIYESVKGGGERLDAFARTAGMSASAFAAAWEESPIDAFQGVVEGLTDIHQSGGDLIGTFDQLGIKGTLNRSVMMRLLGASDLLAQSLDDGRTAWDENSAMAEEAEKRYETTAARLEVFKNQVTNVGRVIGAELIPPMLSGVDLMRDLGGWAYDMGVEHGPRLVGAWDDISAAGADVATILGDMYDLGQPLVIAMAGLGGFAVIKGLSTLATGLANSADWLSENRGATVALTTALTTLALSKAGVALASMFETAAIRGLYFLDFVGRAQSAMVGMYSSTLLIAGGFRQMSVAIATLPAATNMNALSAGVAQMRSGFAGMASIINPATLAIVASTASLYIMIDAHRRSQARAKSWREELEGEIDTTSVMSYQDAMTEALRVEEAARRKLVDLGAGTGEDAAGFWTRAGAQLQYLEEELGPAESKMGDLDKAMKEAGKTAQDLYWDAWGLSHQMSVLALATGLTVDEVEAYVRSLELVPDADHLAENAEAIGEAAGLAATGSPAVESLAGAFGVLDEETASATDQLDAFKEAMDALIGVNISYEQALIGFTGAINDLTTAQTDGFYAGERWSTNLEGTDAASLATRDQVAGLADEAIGLATAYYEAGGGIDGATWSLESNRQAIVDAGVAAGISREDMEAYLDTLGLTPENITTVIAAQTDEESLSAADRALEHTSRDRDMSVFAEAITGGADGHLAHLARDRTARVNVDFDVRGKGVVLGGGLSLFNTGGRVPGSGPNVDSVPSMLTRGEYVVQQPVVNAFERSPLGIGWLDALNSGRLRPADLMSMGHNQWAGYNAGGIVDDTPRTVGFSGDWGSGSLRAWPLGGFDQGLMSRASSEASAWMDQHYPSMLARLAQQTGGLPGSTNGLNPEFLRRFNAYSAAVGGLSITSGFRSYAQQARLYARWMARVPGQAPAAPPGRSNHEKGLAIDHSPHSTAAMRRIASTFRLRYPMSYEPWHVEPFNTGGLVGHRPMPFGIYDQGGHLPKGLSLALNGTGRPEPVGHHLTPADRAFQVQVRVENHTHVYVGNEKLDNHIDKRAYKISEKLLIEDHQLEARLTRAGFKHGR